MDNLILIDVPEYWLLVDANKHGRKIEKDAYYYAPMSLTNIRQRGSTHPPLGCTQIIAHRPLNNSPVLKGVLQLPETASKKWSDEDVINLLTIALQKKEYSPWDATSELHKDYVKTWLNKYLNYPVPIGFEPEVIGIWEQMNNTGKDKVDYTHLNNIPVRTIKTEAGEFLQGRYIWK